MPRLTLLRHGESQWNLENRFTGWHDIGLSPKGELEAKAAGLLLKEVPFDVLFTSVLSRSSTTADIALEAASRKNVPTFRDKALNERDYGDLTGLNKQETCDRYGNEQVHIWRRSYDVCPPNGESLKDTRDRVQPYFESQIVPHLRKGENVLVVAHGNSLRAVIMILEELNPESIMKVEIPTGVPITYELDKDLHIVSKNILTPVAQ